MNAGLRSALLFAAAAATLAAQPFEAWNAFELPLVDVGRFSSLFTTQLRTRSRFHDMYQSRFGGVARVRLTNGFNIVSGFLYTMVESSNRDRWDDQHRAWGGLERSLRAGTGALNFRGIYERHFGGVSGVDNRTRWLARYNRPAGKGILASVASELFTDNHGYMAERLTASIILPVSHGWTAEMGYVWDARLERACGVRQVVTTTFRSHRRDR